MNFLIYKSFVYYYFSFFFYLFLFLLLICPQGFLPTENVLTGHQLAHHHLFSWTTALLTGSFSSPNHRQNSSLISHHHSSVWWALSSSKFCSVRLINCPMQQVFFPIKDFLLVKLCSIFFLVYAIFLKKNPFYIHVRT